MAIFNSETEISIFLDILLDFMSILSKIDYKFIYMFLNQISYLKLGYLICRQQSLSKNTLKMNRIKTKTSIINLRKKYQ